MGKSIAAFMVFVFFLITSASTSLSAPGPPGPRYHAGPRPPLAGPGPRTYHGYGWGYFGAGLLTGAFLTIALTPPPPRKPAPMIYRPVPVVYEEAPVVVVQPPATEPEQRAALRQVTPNPTLLNVRLTPELNSTILGQVSRGEVLDVIGTAPGWLYIRTGTGNYGWVMEQYTRDRIQPAG